MAILKETWTAEDELDYEKVSVVTPAMSSKGVAARVSAGQASDEDRPTADRTSAANQLIIGAFTKISNNGAKVVKKGRFVLQSTAAFVAANVGKSVQTTTTPGKVVATSADATQGQLMIIGGGNDTDPGGIGHHYLVERI